MFLAMGSERCQDGDGEDTSVAHGSSNACKSSNREALVASLDPLSPLCGGQWDEKPSTLLTK